MFKSAHLVAALVIFNLALTQALPPPMLRTVCGVVADAEEAVGNGALAAGKAAVDLAMKPIAIIGGLQAAAVGTGVKVAGGAVKFVGAKMAKDGALFEAAGAGIKGAGLGVAALQLKPAAEKIVAGANVAEGALNNAKNLVGQVGDTSIQLDATIDSPFLGHHHKGVGITAGLETAKFQQQQQQTQQQEAVKEAVKEEPKTKRAAPKLDLDVMRSAMNLVKEAKMEDCVALAICDLNCNPQGFGSDGKQVFMNMVRLQGSSILEESDSKYYREAMSKGRASSGKCDSCAQTYAKCNSKSSDLIKMASHIKMD